MPSFLAAVLLLGLAFPRESYAAAPTQPHCQSLLESHQEAFTSFQAKSFRNAGMLLEFFGPMENSFRAWLKWLEADAPSEASIGGPGLYRSGSGLFVIAKQQVFPFDAGVSEFSGGDISERRIIPLMEFWDSQMQSMRGSSVAARAARGNFLRQLDTHLFGLYGALENNTHDNLLMRTIQGDHTLMASMYPRVQYRATPNWISASWPNVEAPKSPMNDFHQVAKVVSDSENGVLVKVNLGNAGGTLSKNAELIQRMFFITHWQMVQRAYRKSGLFADELDSALYLLDDFIRTMEASNQQQDLYLLYDRRAWQSMMFRLNLAHQYVSVRMTGAGWQPYMYQTIADVFYPFYPSYGVVIESYAPMEFEMKRLFHNPDPDPLQMLGHEGEARIPKFHFYHEVGKQLPLGAKLKAVSKSTLHNRLYRSIGFKLTHSEYVPEWRSQKYTLFLGIEEFLSRTKD
jgi:hypothetical protein